MRNIQNCLVIFLSLLVFPALCPLSAQESRHRILDFVDLPAELNQERHPGCKMEFREEWTLDPASSSLSKKVDEYRISCEDSSEHLSPAKGELRIKNISYEFSFLDLQEEAMPIIGEEKVLKLQKDFIALINALHPLPEFYDPPLQLLSVYFLEDWVFKADQKTINKRVKGIAPVIWQQRQTADGDPVLDAATGYPVYYKLRLEQIDLRQP